MDFSASEIKEGVRFVWNSIPTTRVEASQNIVPLSMLYTPFLGLEEPIVRCETKPITCPSCKWIANSFCQFDYTNFRWDCANCGAKTPLHSQFREYISNGYTLPESLNRNTIIEYKMGSAQGTAWLFVVDLCVSETELAVVKERLREAVEAVQGGYVGLIVFGKHVVAYDFHSAFTCEVVVNGSVEYPPEKLREILGVKIAEPESTVPSRFILPITGVREKLLRVIARLRPDSFAAGANSRKLRSAGQAFGVATALVESFGGSGSRITTLLAGPCTQGPGMVVAPSFADHFRAHSDLENSSDKIVQFRKSEKYYDSLADRLCQAGATVDLFAFSLDQFGIAEMRPMIEKTGGVVINQEEFTVDVFSKSIAKYVELHTRASAPLNARLKLLCAKDLMISGALGPLKLSSKTRDISQIEAPIGEAGGDEFFLGAPLPASTLAFFFAHRNPQVKETSNRCFFQFQTLYATAEGEKILRVATFMREYSSNSKTILSSFDQEAAMAVIARIAASKGNALDTNDLMLWLNSVVIKVVRRFATFTKGKPETFQSAPEISVVPQFMYYFRRSSLTQKFTTSVDEFVMNHMALNREMVSNALVMIQPSLLAYELDKEDPTPVFCDVDALKPDIVILVDTYFYTLIWHGKTIASWVDQGYHLSQDYENLKQLLEKPVADAQIILDDRLPVPKLIKVNQGQPMERLLKSKLTPPNNGKSNLLYQQDDNYITEDTSLTTFMDYLIKLVTK